MAITQEDVARLSRLAGLALSPQAQDESRIALDRMLSLITQLQAVDTAGIEPLAHPLAARQEVALRLREDQPTPTNTEEIRAALMVNAPAAQDGLFLVPRVIE